MTAVDDSTVDEVVQIACEATSWFIQPDYMREALAALAEHGYTIIGRDERERLDSLTAARTREYVVQHPVDHASAFSNDAGEFGARGIAEGWHATIDGGRGEWELVLVTYERWSGPRVRVDTEIVIPAEVRP